MSAQALAKQASNEVQAVQGANRTLPFKPHALLQPSVFELPKWL
jgi:hypothetical protein